MPLAGGTGSGHEAMRDGGSKFLRPALAGLSVLVVAILTSACGVATSKVVLPDFERTRPVTMLDKQQREEALNDLAKVAEEQNKRAAKITPISYEVPEKSR